MIQNQQLSKGYRLESLNTERIEHEEAIHYDIFFKSELPDGNIAYVNIEPQNIDDRKMLHRRSEIYVGYGFVKQKGIDCTAPEYKGLKKLYLIWIGKRNRKKSKVIIEKLYAREMNGEQLQELDYDYQERIYIHLGNERNEDRGIRLLQVLFSGDYRSEEVNDILEKEYGFRLDEEERKVLKEMCNFSKSIEQKGIEKGLLAGRIKGKEDAMLECIQNLMEEAQISIDKAMDLLRVPSAERGKYLSYFQS